MNRHTADIAAGALVAGIVSVGVLTAIQLSVSGDTPGPEGTTPVMAVVGPVLMSSVMASIVGGVYVFVRGQVFADAGADPDVTDDAPGPDEDDGADEQSVDGDTFHGSATNRQLLDVLPEDERQILEPVIESPGLTQIEVRDRSGFSKSKVSQTITDLEGRALLYRERQGRTYRVYPADDIDERL